MLPRQNLLTYILTTYLSFYISTSHILKGQCHRIFDTFLSITLPAMSALLLTMQTCVSVVVDYTDMCQRSQRLCWHTVNYFTLEKEEKILMIKVKKYIGYFWKLCVHKVIDFADINYTDTCWISCWLCRHDVGVVVDHVDILSKYWLITWTPYQRSCWLHRHNNDYLDTFEKLCRFLTDFKGTIMQKMFLDVLTHPIAIIKKIENCLI